MEELLEESYFVWLYDQVGAGGNDPKLTHWLLLRQMHSKEFVWLIPNDDQREEDGIELRYIYARDGGCSPDWFQMPCSFLEMLIGLSRRLSFEAEGEPRDWFWHLMENLRIDTFTDDIYASGGRSFDVINDIMHDVIHRQYDPSGRRGLFPLERPDRDQREVELWFQLQQYLMERA